MHRNKTKYMTYLRITSKWKENRTDKRNNYWKCKYL